MSDKQPSEIITESANLSPLQAVYDSQKHCSAATGIPMAALKRAKTAGCPAFKSNRVYLRPLLTWIFDNPSDAGANNWKEMKEEFQAKREKLRHDKDAGLQVDRGEAVDRIRAGMSTVFSELDRVFCNELPPIQKGLDEIGLRQKAAEAIEQLRAALKEKFALPAKTEDAL